MLVVRDIGDGPDNGSLDKNRRTRMMSWNQNEHDYRDVEHFTKQLNGTTVSMFVCAIQIVSKEDFGSWGKGNLRKVDEFIRCT